MDLLKAEKLRFESIEYLEEAIRRGWIEWAASYSSRIRSLDKIIKSKPGNVDKDLMKLRGIAL